MISLMLSVKSIDELSQILWLDPTSHFAENFTHFLWFSKDVLSRLYQRTMLSNVDDGGQEL